MTEIDWSTDVDEALEQAGETRQPLLLDFNAAPD